MCVRVPVCAYENACVCACEPDFCFVTIVSFRCHNRLQILVDSSFICIYPSLYVWLCVRACACVRMRLSVYVRGQYNVQFKYVTFKIVVHPFEILALKKKTKKIINTRKYQLKQQILTRRSRRCPYILYTYVCISTVCVSSRLSPPSITYTFPILTLTLTLNLTLPLTLT